MGEDRALDEFLGGNGDGAAEDDATAPAEDEEPADDGTESPGDAGAEPGADDADSAGAVSTTAFDPDGAACESCGASVRRRWRDDGALVCADCKAW